jgi:hypothetical protein
MPSVDDMLPAGFSVLAEDILELQAEMSRLEEAIRLKKVEARAIVEGVADAASWSARGDGWTVSYVKPNPRETLVRELLIQQGVTLKQIEKATKTTPSTPYVTFRRAKETQ